MSLKFGMLAEYATPADLMHAGKKFVTPVSGAGTCSARIRFTG